jgi:broad specificity phosphatase PhoE
MKIFIIRHGQDMDNAHSILNGRRNKSLTALGRNQAKAVAQRLKRYHIAFIYTSPLKRAFETAQIVAKQLGIQKIIVREDLIERDFGVLTGKTYNEIPQYATKIIHSDGIKYFLEAKGAEVFPSVYKRAGKVLEEIQKMHTSENVLLVTHGDMAMMLQTAYHGWTWKEGLLMPYLDNTGILELSPKKDILL